MITEIVVSNFRSLGEDVRLRLGSLTALVGQNGAGKSNVADVFRFVAEALTVGLEQAIANRHGINAVRRWSSGRPYNLSIRMVMEEADFSGAYSFTLAGDRSEEFRVKEEEAAIVGNSKGKPGELVLQSPRFRIEDGVWLDGPSDLRPKVTQQSLAITLLAGDERFAPLANALRSICVYSIFPDTLREPQKPDGTKPMKQHGQNWASILQNMTTNGAEADLRAALAKLTGDITDFRVQQLGGYLNAEFRHSTAQRLSKDRQKWFESAQESDGTLRVAGIITALLQKPPLTLIAIEEPELTVHVGAIPLLFDYLKQASVKGQVLVTTHSIELLELLDIDDIRVVDRREGVTQVGSIRLDQRESVRKRLLTVGDIISMEGLQAELFAGQDAEV